jgi:hypothetical protein
MKFWQLVANGLLDSSQDCVVFFVEALENLVDISLHIVRNHISKPTPYGQLCTSTVNQSAHFGTKCRGTKKRKSSISRYFHDVFSRWLGQNEQRWHGQNCHGGK